MRVPSIAIACVCASGVLIAACSPSADAPASKPQAAQAETAPPPAVPAVSALAADHPCRLLADAEVRAAFPGAKAGVPETTREQYGIRACVWATQGGNFALQRWAAKPLSVDNEIRGLSIGFLDPVKATARTAVRYETVPGIGDQAMAVVETQDDKRGILTDAALLIAQRGDQLIELQSQELARGDRAAALQALATLGRSAAARL
jgi:hypothetical protein